MMSTSETLPIPVVSHSSVSSINVLIIAQQYLSEVKRKPSVSAPLIICRVFGPDGGGLGLLRGGSLKLKSTFPENMAGIWLRGRWVSFRQEEGGMCSWEEGVLCVEGRRGGVSELVPNFPQLPLDERCICDVNMWRADENTHLKQR